MNLLTPARVKEAVKEVVTGEMVPLNLEVSELKPCYGRETFEHTIKNIIPRVAFDDLYSMNTQSSTQWDGLRHVSVVFVAGGRAGGRGTIVDIILTGGW